MGHTSTSVDDFWTEPIILWVAIVLPTGKDSGLSFKKIYFKYNSKHYKLVAICVFFVNLIYYLSYIYITQNVYILQLDETNIIAEVTFMLEFA